MRQIEVIYRTVEHSGLACEMHSGSLPVLATPQMIAWMEEACCLALPLEEGKTSVGIVMNCTHDAPCKENDRIRIAAEIMEQNGKIVSFHTSAWLNDLCIGKAEHKRAIVNAERFMQKVNQ